MIDFEKYSEILSLYKKHGWSLRRVLLCAGSKKELLDKGISIFGGAEIKESLVDAAWFSRGSANNNEAWELRHLSDNPYALFELFEEEDDDEVREETLLELEEKLIKQLNI
jgi:hypothetical protein